MLSLLSFDDPKKGGGTLGREGAIYVEAKVEPVVTCFRCPWSFTPLNNRSSASWLMTFDRSLQIEGIDRGRYGFLCPGDLVFYQGFVGQKHSGVVFELGKQAVSPMLELVSGTYF